MPFKVFTNGVPLPASDLNDYLMEQSIATFADSAARAAQLVSPTEGQLTYLADTDKHEFWNGSAWVNFGASETLLSTTTLTGASVTLSSIPQIYTSLKLVIQSFRPATDNTSLLMRYNGITTVSYTSSTANSDGINFSATSMTVSPQVDNGASNGFIVVELPNYNDSINWKLAQSFSIANDAATPTSVAFRRSALFSNITNAITSITLFPGSGNFTSGTALLYGVR